jgi:branched-chain amino acid transport system substrate-binding protein
MKKSLFSVLLLGAMLLASCAPAAAPKGELKVAILAPLSGAVQTFGVSTRDGALLAFEEWNAKGGVLGMKLVPVTADSQCSADPAVNAANKVIDQDKVKYIIGEVCSSASIPVSLITNEKKVVQISPTSTGEAVTRTIDGKVKEYVFRACYSDNFQGVVMADFAISKGFTKGFIMFDQGNDYTVGLASSFEKEFLAKGGTVVGKETYTKSDTDFSAILSKVADSGAQMVLLPDYYPIVNLVYAQAKEKGITAPFMGGDGWDSSDLDLKAVDGGFYSNHYSPEDTRPIVQDFIKKYKAKYNSTPDALAVLAYDAANILFESIQKAGVDDTTAVKDAMAKLNVVAVSGTFVFNEFHNPVKPAVVLQVKDGKVTYVTTVAP